jgi:hypothetical protein
MSLQDVSNVVFCRREKMTCSCKESKSKQEERDTRWWFDCHECGRPQYSFGVIPPYFYKHLCGGCDPDDKCVPVRY